MQGGGRAGQTAKVSKRWGYLVAWLLAAGLAVTVGVVAASTVGASIRGRGPIGPEVGVDTAVEATPDPDAPAVRDRIEGEYGAFVVECRGTFASGIRAEPARADPQLATSCCRSRAGPSASGVSDRGPCARADSRCAVGCGVSRDFGERSGSRGASRTTGRCDAARG